MIRLNKSAKIPAMLQRFAVHFSLIFLFAFTQLGVVTHEISHLNEFSPHSQQDKKASTEACSQCLSYAQVASGLQSSSFALPSIAGRFSTNSSYYFNSPSTLQRAYAARAPPQKISV
ncbi:MAG: hypothetical protein EXR38_03235 [Methylotenera sp.]|nr:hypothetical protein [Methylotenera sp.]MSP99504.1 hypothetical protein [Methylotenera sp.]